MNDTSDDLEKRHAEMMRAAEEKRKATRKLVSELQMKWEIETAQPRGVEFEIVETLEGPIVVRAGEMVLYKRFQAAIMKDKIDHEDIYAFVRACLVYPDAPKFDAMAEKRAAIVMRCANALTVLYGGKGDDEKGKF